VVVGQVVWVAGPNTPRGAADLSGVKEGVLYIIIETKYVHHVGVHRRTQAVLLPRGRRGMGK
jgi:hypothetical protein